MAVRGWGGSVATAIGVAAGAGAAQLGLGYGLGIVVWLPSTDGVSKAAWTASLVWAVWIAATSTVAGAYCAHRLSGGGRRSTDSDAPTATSGLWRAVLAVSSAIGGLVTVVLVAVPARAAVRPDTGSPQTTAAGYALLGVLLGLLMAIWAISSPAVAANVLATVGWLWALAVIAVTDSVLSGRGLTDAQLGIWKFTSDSERFWLHDYFYWPGAALSLGSALLIGVFAARAATRRPTARVGAAISGLSGPLLVAVAYFLATPRLVDVRAEQVSAHLMAPYAVIAGVAGSALMAALAQRSEALAQRREALAQRPETLAQRPEALARHGESDEPRPAAPDRAGEPKSAGTGEPDDGSTRASGDATVAATGAGRRRGGDRAEGGTGSRPKHGADGDSDRTARLPEQPVGGSWRTSGDDGPYPARPGDDGAYPARPGRLPGAEAGDPTGQSPDVGTPDVGTPDVGTPDEGTDEPTPTVEPGGLDRMKGRLGRLGRRSR